MNKALLIKKNGWNGAEARFEIEQKVQKIGIEELLLLIKALKDAFIKLLLARFIKEF